jgi:XRE family transcriptional regulator, regulator of sulfur utilization
LTVPDPTKTISSKKERRLASPLNDFNSSIGDRLRALIRRQGGSFEKLAAFSGLGKKTLGAVALGNIVPTVQLLWKIANALGVPFGSLVSAGGRPGMFVLRNAQKRTISSSDGGFTSRPLFPHDSKRLVEFYELTVAPRHTAYSDAHAPGTIESLVVVRGQIEIAAGKEPAQRLEEGDAMVFDGDVPHKYRNLGSSEALIYLVMSYINLTDA